MSCNKVIVGGGTGFIGKRLGELLLAERYNVVNVSRMPGASNISWTELEKSGLPDGVSAVVNCAGQQFMDATKLWTPGFKQNVHNSRVYTTQALARAINKKPEVDKPKVYVVITGVGAYEPSPFNKYDEDSPTTGSDFFSKLTAEMERSAEVKPPVRLVVIRSGVVLGRWGGMVKNMFLPFYLGVGGRIGSGKQYLPWIHIDDLTRLIHFAIENKHVKGVLNGVAPHIITNEEFTKSFAKALKRPAFIPVPELIVETIFHPERASIILQGQCVEPKRVLEYGFTYEFDSIDKACREMGSLVYKKPPIKPYESIHFTYQDHYN